MTDDGPGIEAAATACLEKTRSAILNVLVVVGAGIAVSGWVLGRRDAGALLWDPESSRRVAIAALVGLIAASQLSLRIGSRRSALRDPGRRARRFARSHLGSALIGALAVPLGFAYGWAIQPRLEEVSPFWVVALATGFLAIPREGELAGFDRPMPDADDPAPETA